MRAEKTLYKEVISGSIPDDWAICSENSLYTRMFVKAMADSLLEFCVATRFSYKDIDAIIDSDNIWSIQNDSKTAWELFDLIVFERLRRNQCLHGFLNAKLVRDAGVVATLNEHLHEMHTQYANRLHDSKIFECLDEYKDEYSKKKLGDVQTPYKLAQEICARISCQDPKNILDSAGGVGTFIFCMREIWPGANYYFNDINLKKCYITNGILNSNGNDDVKIYCSDFLKEFGILKNIPPKFDVIVGNPPFTRGLDQKFLNRSLELLKNDGYIAYITPRAWMGNNTSGGNNFDGFYKYDMKLLHVWSAKFQKNYFDIGTGICWYIIQKSIGSNNIKIVYDESIEIETSIESNGRGFPDVIDDMTLKIHQQLCKYDQLIPIGDLIASGERKNIDDTLLLQENRLNDTYDDTNYCYKHYTSHQLIRWANFKHVEFSNIRLGWYVQQRLTDAFIIETSNTGQDIYRVICNNRKEAENLKKIINSKFYRYIDKFYGSYGRAPLREIRRILPRIDYSRTYTDIEIYQYFNLTNDMIAYIEKVI